ncbi:ATP-binding protein [Shimia sp.]|uniref:ATP-binding protein n=1 Tax=Shimia sp. TaxID=1954381 RepID=UPI003565CE40
MSSDPSCFKIRARGTQAGVRLALAHVVDRLASAGADRDFRGRAEIVLAEALNNVVEHALHGQACLWVEIRARKGDAGWHFLICDPGRPMPDGLLPQRRLPAVDAELAELPEGGFGWAMIRLLASAIEYSRRSGQNRLGFLIPHAASGPG